MQISKVFPLLIILSFSAVLTACETTPKRPILYPNSHLTSVGNDQAQRDIDACMLEARNYGIEEKRDAEVGKKAAKGATIGAVTAGAWGLVRGDAGERALAGAAAGGAGGIASGAFDANELSPTYKNFVQKCLGEHGYETIGWQ